jgi:hypothetical protein
LASLEGSNGMTFDVAMTLPTGLPRFPGAFTRGVAILTACQSAVVFRVYPQGGEPVESKSHALGLNPFSNIVDFS